MSKRLRFTRRGRWAFYCLFGVLLLSGFGWMAAHWFMGVESEFGPVRSPAEPLWLRVHGAAAMGVLVLLGYVVAKHVGPAWRSGRNRFSGGVMVLIHLLLIATGYLLYYAGAESWREWSSAVHIALGTALPLVLLGHIWGGRRTRRL